jgi:hypothetical protein
MLQFDAPHCRIESNPRGCNKHRTEYCTPKELACLSRPRGRQVSDVEWNTFLILFPTSTLNR